MLHVTPPPLLQCILVPLDDKMPYFAQADAAQHADYAEPAGLARQLYVYHAMR